MAESFGPSGNSERLIPEIIVAGVKALTFIAKNAGAVGSGLWMLAQTQQSKIMVSSYVSEQKLFDQQFLSDEL